MILGGDIGGTKTRIALYKRQQGRLVQQAEESYASREHAGLEAECATEGESRVAIGFLGIDLVPVRVANTAVAERP